MRVGVLRARRRPRRWAIGWSDPLRISEFEGGGPAASASRGVEVSPQLLDRLYRAAWAICGSPGDAEDLVQEMFDAIAALPDDFREALVAVDVVGLSHRRS